MLVLDIIALVYVSSFVFAPFTAFRQLVTLFNTKTKQVTKVNFLILASSLVCYVLPLSDA